MRLVVKRAPQLIFMLRNADFAQAVQWPGGSGLGRFGMRAVRWPLGSSTIFCFNGGFSPFPLREDCIARLLI
jgi:hypothetical protein